MVVVVVVLVLVLVLLVVLALLKLENGDSSDGGGSALGAGWRRLSLAADAAAEMTSGGVGKRRHTADTHSIPGSD